MSASGLAGLLASGAGIVLALVFDYFPGLNTFYAGLSKNAKKGIMIALLGVVSAIVMAASCIQIYDAVTCDTAGVTLLIQAFVQAAIANQVAHKIAPQLSKVEDVKSKMPF